ncbi:hypothetical protein V8E36_005224 [Tilletia maclaganii]
MATGEKATLRLPAPFDHARLDIYPYYPPIPATSGLSLSEIDRPLPFLLYLHDGLLPFHSGSRIDAPPQVVAWCQARGVPFLSLDYTLLSNPPSCGHGPALAYSLEDVWASVEACWKFINNTSVLPGAREVDIEETLRWQITATGHGAETDTDTQPLDETWREFQPRGIDGRAGMIWGTGAGGWLASLAAGRLHPPPLAVVLERPILDLTTPPPPLPTLPQIIRSPPPFPYTGASPSFPGISDRLWLEGMDANQEEAWRKNAGMDTRRPLAGERDGAQALRVAIDAFEAVRTRGNSYASAFSQGQIASTSAAALSEPNINQPFPPTLILTNTADAAQSEAQRFLDAIRRASPEGAIADQLISRGGNRTSSSTTTKQERSALPSNLAAQRYSHLALDDSTLTVPLLQGRSQMMTNIPPAPFAFLSQHLADALFLRASREGADGSGVVEELRRQAHELLGQAKL